jgi:hypothetical protein
MFVSPFELDLDVSPMFIGCDFFGSSFRSHLPSLERRCPRGQRIASASQFPNALFGLAYR